MPSVKDENPMATNEVGSSPEEQEDENPSEADSSSSPVRIKPAGPKSGFFTIYKSGQGYWTRMGTAAAALLLAVLTVGFLYQQLPVPLTPAFTPSNLDTISNHVDGPTLSPADNAARLAQ